MGDVGPYGNYFVALIFFVVGLHLMGFIPMPWAGAGQVGMKKRGLVAAFVLGLVFGIALGPCTFAFMAPVLAVAFKVGAREQGIEELFVWEAVELIDEHHATVMESFE